eukprot:1152793-Pelagomonas_calceolata.AAC.3
MPTCTPCNGLGARVHTQANFTKKPAPPNLHTLRTTSQRLLHLTYTHARPHPSIHPHSNTPHTGGAPGGPSNRRILLGGSVGGALGGLMPGAAGPMTGLGGAAERGAWGMGGCLGGGASGVRGGGLRAESA